MSALPLQVIDNFLLQYHVGQALVLVFVLATLGVLPLKSRKILGLQTLAFGLIFLVTPASLMNSEPLYKFFGIALLVVGPFLVIMGER